MSAMWLLSMDNAERWGLPDWTNAAAYPHPDDAIVIWWWEFTRRDRHYRRLVSETLKTQEYGHDQLFYPDGEWLRIHFGLTSLFDPTKQFSLEQLQWMYEPLNKVERPVVDIVRREWSHWDQDDLEDKFEQDRLRVGARQQAGIVSIDFDLNKPRSPQLENADVALRKQQNVKQGRYRHQKDKWPRYLRVMDARCVGLTRKAIGQFLAPTHSDPARFVRDAEIGGVEVRAKLLY